MRAAVKYLLLFSGGGGAAAFDPEDFITPLFQDTYSVNEAAPIAAARSDVPLGDSTVTQNNGAEFEIASTRLRVAVESPGTGNSLVQGFNDSIARANGVVVKTIMQVPTVGITLRAGFHTSASAPPTQSATNIQGTNIRAFDNASNSGVLDVVSTGVDYQFATVSRSPAGAYHLIKGGAFTNWTLLLVSGVNVTDPIYARIGLASVAGLGSEFDDFTVAQMGGNWAISDGLATYNQSNVAPTTTFTHSADFVALIDFGTISATPQIFQFRKEGPNNYWQITADSTSTDLDEVVDVEGVPTPTQRATGSVVGSAPMTLRVHGTTVQLLNAAGAQVFQYTSASNFQAETDGEYASGDVNLDYLKIFPRDLGSTSEDVQILEAV